VQYYHRYMALLVLEDYEGVVRDTHANLRVLDLCAKHASTESDRAALEQFRPYITMMRARAIASQAIKDNEPKAALHAIDEGLEALRSTSRVRRAGPLRAVRRSPDAPRHARGPGPQAPRAQKSELKQRLAKAIEAGKLQARGYFAG
jgi:hypothetical protein